MCFNVLIYQKYILENRLLRKIRHYIGVQQIQLIFSYHLIMYPQHRYLGFIDDSTNYYFSQYFKLTFSLNHIELPEVIKLQMISASPSFSCSPTHGFKRPGDNAQLCSVIFISIQYLLTITFVSLHVISFSINNPIK